MKPLNLFCLVLICAVGGTCLSGVSLAGSSECQDAISEYNSAISDVSTTLRRYATCVSSSNGHDDCSSEFRRLKNAQDSFETAVSNYSSECN